MALLWCLYLLREKLGITLSAAHFNHGLREGESDRDEAFVRDFCAGYGIPLAVGRGAVRARGRGLEDAARRARYAFLDSLDGSAKIATAHTADDNAETVLLHLLRGAGLRGLGGIAPARDRIVRPMLCVTRREVEAFLREWSLPHVEDSSNRQTDFLRNRLRHQVMPLLKAENPRFSRACSETALRLRQDELLLSGLARETLEQIRRPGGLDCPALLELHPALRRRVLTLYLRESGVAEPEAVHLAQAESLAGSRKPSAWAVFPGGVLLGRQYDVLGRLHLPPPLTETALAVPGRTQVSGWEIQCRFSEGAEKIENTPFTFAVACDTMMKTPWVLRARRAGDRLRLPSGHRSLQKLLVDRKIPAQLRDSLPVVAAGDQILGVGGIGVNLDWAAAPDEPALEIVLSKLN